MRKKQALQTCKVCRQEFAPDHTFVVKSKRCPHCGIPVSAAKANKSTAIVFASVLILLIMMGLYVGVRL